MKQTAVTKQKTLDVIMNLTGLVQHLMRNSQKYGPLKFVLDSWLADAGIDEQDLEDLRTFYLSPEWKIVQDADLETSEN